MQNDWLLSVASGTLLLVLGLIGGLSFAVLLEVGQPIAAPGAPSWCGANPVVCILWEWQTLMAGLIAFAGAIITVRHMRRERRMAALTRTSDGIGHAQAAIFSLRATRASISAIHTAIGNGEAIPRKTLQLLTWDGVNIPQTVDPITHFIVRDAWVRVQHVYTIANRTGAPEQLTKDDADGLATAIQKIDETIANVEQVFIEPLVSEMRKIGFAIWRDEHGVYRHDTTVKPRI